MYKGKETCDDCIFYKMIDSGYGYEIDLQDDIVKNLIKSLRKSIQKKLLKRKR